MGHWLFRRESLFWQKKAEECKAINDKIERALFRVDLFEDRFF